MVITLGGNAILPARGTGTFEEQLAITRAHAPSLSAAACAWIVNTVDAVRAARISPVPPTVRSCIKIGRVLAGLEVRDVTLSPAVREIFMDVLGSGASRTGAPTELQTLRAQVDQILSSCTKGA